MFTVSALVVLRTIKARGECQELNLLSTRVQAATTQWGEGDILQLMFDTQIICTTARAIKICSTGHGTKPVAPAVVLSQSVIGGVSSWPIDIIEMQSVALFWW